MTARAVKTKVSEQKLWLTKLDRICRREQVEDERSYTLINQGISNEKCKFVFFFLIFLLFPTFFSFFFSYISLLYL